MKIGIVTINDYNNYGNRLQNYATQEILKKLYNCEAITIRNDNLLNYKSSNKFKYDLKKIKYYINKIKNSIKKSDRKKYFLEFNKNIKFSKKIINPYNFKFLKDYDYFITGSDQVWNPYGRMSDIDLLEFAHQDKRISLSASFAVDKIIEESKKEKCKNALMKFKKISVREETGKKIATELTNRDDIEVLIDPTMLLTKEDWSKVSKRPKQLKTDKYILNYFLGNLSEQRKQEISRVALENDCEIINILDKNSEFYKTGPSEFLYLEENAFLICTDSFHSSIFAILYDRPVIIFEREDKKVSMNSRIENLINKLGLRDRKFNGKITEENLEHDYTNAYKVLEKEKIKVKNFLKNAIDIKENE